MINVYKYENFLDACEVSTVPSEVYQQLYESHLLPENVRLHSTSIDLIRHSVWIPRTHLKSMINTSRNRAIKKYFTFGLTFEHLLSIWVAQRGKCAISRMPLDTDSGTLTDKNPYKVSIDRIDNNKGYTISNIRLVNHFVNNAKNTWDDKLFYEMIKNIWLNRLGEPQNLFQGLFDQDDSTIETLEIQ